MEKLKFLEAQNLIEKINQLKNCIEVYKNNNKSHILISWIEYIQSVNNLTNFAATTIRSYSDPEIKQRYQRIPEEYESEIIKLLEEKVNELEIQFKDI